jgi:peroxiredoxin Q/BCP
MKKIKYLLTLAALAVLGTQWVAADHHEELKVGDKVPAFNAINQDGQLWKSDEFIGKKNVIVYFYPAAMTGGCTKQACAFRDDSKKLSDLDTVVVGVSGDVPAGLKIFQQSYDLNFDLLADYNGQIAKVLGVATRDGGSIKRQFQGAEVVLERGITTMRWTFIIDKDGKLAYKNTKVNAAEDSKNVIEFLKSQKG